MKIYQSVTVKKTLVSFKLFYKNQNNFVFKEMQNGKQVCFSIVQTHGLLISSERFHSTLQRTAYYFISILNLQVSKFQRHTVAYSLNHGWHLNVKKIDNQIQIMEIWQLRLNDSKKVCNLKITLINFKRCHKL